MSLWVLDTDHVSLFQHRHPLVIRRVNAINSEDLGVTVITVEEQMRGWLNAIRQSSQPDRLLWAYMGLRTGVEYFNGVNLLDFDQEAYNCLLRRFDSSKDSHWHSRFAHCGDRTFEKCYPGYAQ